MTKQEAEYSAKARVQFNTNELHNLIVGYRRSLKPIKGNTLTRKQEKALGRCMDRAEELRKGK